MLPHCGTAISIHAPREGGDHPIPKNSGKTIISIHAPREGGDIAIFRRPPAQSAISIHAPREGGDLTGVFLFTVVL